MRRVSVMGSSGSGKTTFAAALAQRLDTPHVELDAIHHLPDWEPIDPTRFRAEVTQRCAGDRWVIDGNYRAVRDIVLSRADTVVFLDLPRWRVMSQVIRRSARRSLTGEELWNGNRESVRNLLSLDEQRNIVLWSWNHFDTYRRRYLDGTTDPDLAQLRWIRLRSHAEAASLLRSIGT